MMNWIHCNSCYVQPGQDAPRFIITSCGHIFCIKCIEKGSPGKCQICQNEFTTTDLNDGMKPEVKEYFGSPIEMAQKLLSVATFQDGHMKRFFNRMRAYQAKYIAVRAEAVKACDENVRLRKRIKNMEMTEGWYKTQLASMKRKVEQLRQENARILHNGEYSPAPNLPTPSSDFDSPNPLPSVKNGSQYRSQMNFTPFTPASASTNMFSGSSGFTRGTSISTGDSQYQNSARRPIQRIQTPAQFSSPSVLRPLDFQDNRGTPYFRRNL